MDELLVIRQLNRTPVINFLLRDAFTYVSLYYGANLHQHELVVVSLRELNCQI